VKEVHTDKYWENVSGKQKALLYNPGNILKREAIFSYIIRYDSQKLRILDVGGGVGDIALDFFQRGFKSDYIVHDIARNALREAKTTLQYFPCEFIQADAQKLKNFLLNPKYSI
jgi:ubiquinone/menaquinone biosynthesis C-methylase UbiE